MPAAIFPVVVFYLAFVQVQGQMTEFSRLLEQGGRAEGGAALKLRDGGIILAGSRQTDTGIDLTLTRLDKDGRNRWERTWDFSAYDTGEAIWEAPDGSLYITGISSGQSDRDYDSRLTCISAGGQLQWTRTYGGGGWDWIRHMVPTGNGLALLGWTDSYGAGEGECWLLEVDLEGEKRWLKTYGGLDHDEGIDLVHTDDHGFLILGTTRSFALGGQDLWLIRTDNHGEILWSRVYGGDKSEEGSRVYNIATGFLVLGMTSSYGHGESDVWFLKIDPEGEIAGNVTLGGTQWDWGSDLAILPEGFLLVGSTLSYGAGESDVWLVGLNAAGEELWSRTYGGAGSDFGLAFISVDEAGAVMLGRTHSFGDEQGDLWIIHTDRQGNLLD